MSGRRHALEARLVAGLALGSFAPLAHAAQAADIQSEGLVSHKGWSDSWRPVERVGGIWFALGKGQSLYGNEAWGFEGLSKKREPRC